MLADYQNQLTKGQDLNIQQTEDLFEILFNPQTQAEEIEKTLLLFRDKKEVASEIIGALNFLSKKMVLVENSFDDLIDVCGTGGDGLKTFNISTAVAFVLAGAGLRVAKHGNRAVSSQSGSSDVLGELGITPEANPQKIKDCLKKVGLAFLFAPFFHPALKTVGPIRQKIKTKTIFNLLGPLLNPAKPAYQVIGVYDESLIPIFAEVMKSRSQHKAFALVWGHDGMDEITMTNTSTVYLYKDQKEKTFTLDPRDFGYELCDAEKLIGGDAKTNAKRLTMTLKGHSLPADHAVHLNAALALVVSGKANDITDGLLIAQESISSQKAYQKLEKLIQETANQ